MEKELNIAAILKEKPKNTKLWSPIFGECEVRHINNDINASISVAAKYSLNSYGFIKDGRLSERGEICLFPSKQMRNWSKFAWKKGDVLCGDFGKFCIFDKWANDQYTEFYGRYPSPTYSKEGDKFDTESWSSGIEGIVKITFIKNIEEHYGGKLNLSTLDIEQPKQEFKDGDVMFVEKTKIFPSSIFIYKDDLDNDDEDIACYAHFDYDKSEVELFGGLCIEERKYRPATDSEKQQLFAALEKEGKVWNPDTLQIEDLPKKCEFKQMDLCLMSEGYDESLWSLCQFAFKDGEGFYHSIGGGIWRECIPYNDSTKHLLGTTDEWEGGEL